MTTFAPDPIRDGGADVRELPAAVELVERLREANAVRPRQAWSFFVDASDVHSPSLSIGLAGERGALSWSDGRRSMRPVIGDNTEHVDYWTGGHHIQFGPGSEVPADCVYEAVAEFVVTRRQPTCVDWRD